MRPQASRIENYPDTEAKLNKHIAETEVHGSSGFSLAWRSTIIRSMANSAFENFEIAAYKSLLAQASGNDIAEWLDKNIETVTLGSGSRRDGHEIN